MHSGGVTNTSDGTENGFSLSGYSNRRVFLTNVSVTVVLGCRGQRVIAGCLT